MKTGAGPLAKNNKMADYLRQPKKGRIGSEYLAIVASLDSYIYLRLSLITQNILYSCIYVISRTFRLLKFNGYVPSDVSSVPLRGFADFSADSAAK